MKIVVRGLAVKRENAATILLFSVCPKNDRTPSHDIGTKNPPVYTYPVENKWRKPVGVERLGSLKNLQVIDLTQTHYSPKSLKTTFCHARDRCALRMTPVRYPLDLLFKDRADRCASGRARNIFRVHNLPTGKFRWCRTGSVIPARSRGSFSVLHNRGNLRENGLTVCVRLSAGD
jgi:hypothetical protein